MSYGHGDNKALKRMIELTPKQLEPNVLKDLLTLRQRYIDAANQFAPVVFVAEPLQGFPYSSEMDKVLLPLQAQVTGLNKAYVEKARMAVANAVNTLHWRYYSNLVGRLRYVDSKIDPPGNRIYYYVPPDIQAIVTEQEFQALKTLALREDTGFWDAITLFCRVIHKRDYSGLTANQVIILQEIYRQVHERHHCPVFSKGEQFTCQIHLDNRLIRKIKEGEPLVKLQEGIECLVKQTRTHYQCTLAISNPVPGGPPLIFHLTLHAHIVLRLVKNDKACAKSLVIEISDEGARVKLVVEQKKPKKPALNKFDAIIGEDFGYKNTLTFTVTKRDRKIKAAEVEKIQGLDKQGAKDYLASHEHPMDQVLHRQILSGRDFLALINQHCEAIDKLRSTIDRTYNHISKLKEILCGYLKLKPEARIDPGIEVKNDYISRILKRFFHLLEEVYELKARRRALYAKIKAIKLSWFGFVANLVVQLAQKYNAFVVREALDIVAPEKGSPEYKGRTFNKMINNGSQGQFHVILDGKLDWFGIPDVPVPSFYTSSTCVPHGRVDKKMRKKDDFNCPDCPEKRHADQNAADTIAHYLLLRPKAAAGAPVTPGKKSAGKRKRSTCEKAPEPVPGAAPEGSTSGGNRVSGKPRPTASRLVVGAFTL